MTFGTARPEAVLILAHGAEHCPQRYNGVSWLCLPIVKMERYWRVLYDIATIPASSREVAFSLAKTARKTLMTDDRVAIEAPILKSGSENVALQ